VSRAQRVRTLSICASLKPQNNPMASGINLTKALRSVVEEICGGLPKGASRFWKMAGGVDYACTELRRWAADELRSCVDPTQATMLQSIIAGVPATDSPAWDAFRQRLSTAGSNMAKARKPGEGYLAMKRKRPGDAADDALVAATVVENADALIEEILRRTNFLSSLLTRHALTSTAQVEVAELARAVSNPNLGRALQHAVAERQAQAGWTAHDVSDPSVGADLMLQLVAPPQVPAADSSSSAQRGGGSSTLPMASAAEQPQKQQQPSSSEQSVEAWAAGLAAESAAQREAAGQKPAQQEQSVEAWAAAMLPSATAAAVQPPG